MPRGKFGRYYEKFHRLTKTMPTAMTEITLEINPMSEAVSWLINGFLKALQLHRLLLIQDFLSQ